MLVMQISKHTPESCPTVVESNKKITVALFQNLESLAAKHGVKLVGSWTDYPMHLVYNIYDAPDMEAFLNMNMEPEVKAWLRFNTMETKVVSSLVDVKNMLGMK